MRYIFTLSMALLLSACASNSQYMHYTGEPVQPDDEEFILAKNYCDGKAREARWAKASNSSGLGAVDVVADGVSKVIMSEDKTSDDHYMCMYSQGYRKQ